MSVARGKQCAFMATGAAALLMLAAPSARAADPWKHLSISPMAEPTPGVAAGVEVVPVTMFLPRPPHHYADLQGERLSLTAESIGCLVTGGAATLAALGLGWENVTNLISGGIVAGAGPGAATLGLFGVVFVSYCAISQALIPRTRLSR